jgi:hypothetical protein
MVGSVTWPFRCASSPNLLDLDPVCAALTDSDLVRLQWRQFQQLKSAFLYVHLVAMALAANGIIFFAGSSGCNGVGCK